MSGRVDDVFQAQYPSGALAANSEGVLGGPGHPQQGLGEGDTTSLLNLIDTIDISPAAQAAADSQHETSAITGSTKGAPGIPPSRGDLDGSAYIKNGIMDLGKTS